MAPQIIRTPAGEELAVLPRAEYDRLVALAAAAGISAAYLSQIEGGRREGTLSTMAAIARALGVRLDDLAAGSQ